MWKWFKGIVGSIALVLSGTIISLLAASFFLIGGAAVGCIVLICGIALCVVIATLPTSKVIEWAKAAKKELA